MFGKDVHELLVKISGDSQGLQRSLSESEQKLKTFGDNITRVGKTMTIVGGAITAAFGAIVTKTVQVGDELDKMSKRTNVAVEELSALGYAAKISGTDLDTVERGLRYMVRGMNDAARGIGESKRAFDQLNISIQDTDGNLRPTMEVFKEAAQRLSEMTNETEQIALATEIFGSRYGTALLPMLKEGEKGIESLMQKAKELGIVMSTEAASKAAELNDRMTDLRGSLAGAGRTIGEILIPVIIPLVEKITALVQRMAVWAEENQGLVKAITLVAATLGGLLAVGGPILIAIGLFTKMAISIKGITTAMTAMATFTKASFVPAIGSANIALGTMAAQFGLIAANVYIWSNVLKEAQKVLQSTHTSAKDVKAAQNALADAQQKLADKLGITVEKLKEYQEQGYSVIEMQQGFKNSNVELAESFDEVNQAVNNASETFQQYYERMQDAQAEYNRALEEQKRLQQEAIDAQIAGMEQLAREFEIRFPELITKQVNELEKIRQKYIDIIEASQLSAEEQIAAIEKVNNKIDEQIAKLTDVEETYKKTTTYLKYDAEGNILGTTSQHVLSAEEQVAGVTIQKLHTGIERVPRTGAYYLEEGEKVIARNENKGMTYSPNINIVVEGDGDESKIRRAIEQALDDSARQFRRSGYELIPGIS